MENMFRLWPLSARHFWLSVFFLRLQEIFEAGPALCSAEDGCFEDGVVRLRDEEERLFRADNARMDKFSRHNRIVM